MPLIRGSKAGIMLCKRQVKGLCSKVKEIKKHLEEYVEHFHHNCLLAGEPELLPWVEMFFTILFEAGIGYLVLRFSVSEYAHDIVYMAGFLFIAAMITRKKGFAWFLYRSFLYSSIFAMIMAVGYCIVRSTASDAYISIRTGCVTLVLCIICMTIVSAIITYRRMFIRCRKRPYNTNEQVAECSIPLAGTGIGKLAADSQSKVLSFIFFLVIPLGLSSAVLEVVPFIMAYVFSKIFDLDTELIEKNKRLREKDKKEKERKRVEEEGPFKF